MLQVFSLLLPSILILLSATAKAYDGKVSCKVSINEKYGKTCRLENVNLEAERHLEVEIDTKSLKYVYFQSSSIESFTEGIAEQLRGVEYLNVNGVGLERLNQKSLERLPELLIFWSGSNKIKRLEANAFSGNKNLEEIWLKFNRINFIDATAFDDLDQLRLLDLSSNKLKVVLPVFNSNINLEKLDLSSNLIEKIDRNAFTKLEALRELNLQHNKMKLLDPTVFNPLSSLEFINISFNKSPIRTISGDFLQHNSRLKDILLINNGIEAIDKKFLTNSKPSLRLLSLRSNRCVDDDIEAAKGIEFSKLNKCLYVA